MYVTFNYNGYDIDLVPCYPYTQGAGLQSAVDRTPAHNEYVISSIDGREDEVLLLKQFLLARGIYGSELRTQGFSGYLCEILILKFGSFRGVLGTA